jgi:hypothetical protein
MFFKIFFNFFLYLFKEIQQMIRVERPNLKPLKLAVPNVTTATGSAFVYFYVPRDTRRVRTLP